MRALSYTLPRKERVTTMFQEFKKFAMRGNVLDMAVGIILGAAFGQIVNSLVNDLLMPPLGLLLGKVDFANLFLSLSSRTFQTLAEARAAGAPTLNYGLFINTVLNFLIVAFAVFLLIRQVNRWTAKPTAVTARECPYCLMNIPLKATVCGHCASQLSAGQA